jgi:hypothetical protein
MKVNVKLYNLVNGQSPLDVQQIDNRNVEIYSMVDFPQVKEEFIRQGRFAVWSSVDGNNYRIFIEPGYYNEFKELYSLPVNKIWVDFWDACEKLSHTATFKIIIPVTGVALAACVGLSFWKSEISSYISIALVILAFLVMMISNSRAKSKIQQENVKSVELIKKEVGEKRFEQLIEARKDYTDKYFAAIYPEDVVEDEAETEALEEPVVEEAQVVETTEAEETEEKVIE